MTTRKSISLLLVLPITLIFLSLLYKSSIGEYFIGGFYDPAYNYLINSLNLSQFNGYGVGNFDHPGTPIQVMGAFVIKFFYWVSGTKPDIAEDVFSRPEYYLMKIFLVIVLINAAALFILGFISYKRLNDIRSAMILQLSPFFFSPVFFELTNFTSEPFLIFTILILISVIISFLTEENISDKRLFKYSILFGIICGFGFACKISIFPVFIIPLLLLRKFSLKAVFLGSLVITFMIFIYPAFSSDNASKYSSWVKGVITHSGKYGEGSEDFIEISKFSVNLKTILFNDPLFSFTYLIILSGLISHFFLKSKQKIRSNKYFILLFGIFLAMTGQIIIVAKHFEPHYMIPAMMFTVLGLFTFNAIFYQEYSEYFGKYKTTYISLILIIFLYLQTITIFKETTYFTNRRNESYKAMNYLKQNYKDLPVVSTYGSSSREFSLYLGVYWGGTQKSRYAGILNRQNPNYYYFDRWRKDFDDISDVNKFKDQVGNSKQLIFQTDSKEVLNNFIQKLKILSNNENITFKSVFSNFRGESIYEINLE